jgi:hypothetical protein
MTVAYAIVLKAVLDQSTQDGALEAFWHQQDLGLRLGLSHGTRFVTADAFAFWQTGSGAGRSASSRRHIPGAPASARN